MDRLNTIISRLDVFPLKMTSFRTSFWICDIAWTTITTILLDDCSAKLALVKQILILTIQSQFQNSIKTEMKTGSNGQVDSPESSETPEIAEMMENFTKVTKYLTKSKETSINYGWENLTSKSSKKKFFHGFRVFKYAIW